MPLFSIITVTYNASTVITPTLKSVFSQNFIDYEYIIIDGKSTDDTVDKVRALNFKNITIHSEKDSGIYDAMNKGLKLAKGDYIVFLNAGDSFHNNNVLSHVASLIADNHNPGIVYGQTDIVDANRKFLSTRHLTAPVNLDKKSFSKGMLVCHQAFFVARQLAPLYNTDYRFSADYEWCIKCLEKSRNNIYAGDEPLIDYLNEGATTKNRFKSLCERFKIMAENYGVATTVIRHIGFIFRAIRRKSL